MTFDFSKYQKTVTLTAEQLSGSRASGVSEANITPEAKLQADPMLPTKHVANSLLAKYANQLIVNQQPALTTALQSLTVQTVQSGELPRTITVYDASGTPKDIVLNDKQYEAAKLAAMGASFCLVGAAGTGKTTSTQASIRAIMQSGNCLVISDNTHKHLKKGSPGILITSYTRRANNNIRRQMPLDLAGNCITTHKALEYSPVLYERYNEKTGVFYKIRIFEPQRTALNKLCSNITVVVIEEGSMMSVDLYNLLLAALPAKVQFIFLGDLNQLPPVFGHAILGYKLLELPVIELTEVYRQALESPIIKLAHRILSGKPMLLNESKDYEREGELQIIKWPKPMKAETAMLAACKIFYKAYDAGSYNPTTDMILCPQVNDKETSDRKFNTTLINKYIAHHISHKNNQPTHEIVAGFRKAYYAVGDKVIYDKQDGIITEITANDDYIGMEYQAPSLDLNYFGVNPVEYNKMINNTDLDLDKLLFNAEENEQEGMKLKASHTIKIRLSDAHLEDDLENDPDKGIVTVKTVGDLLALSLGYAQSVHASQGSEFDKVYLLLHSSHNAMLSRELLYTAVTRAKRQLIILCDSDSLSRGIVKQRIRGNTLAEKAEYFKGKLDDSSYGGERNIDEL